MRDDYPELYDLSTDPEEKNDVAAQHPEMVSHYKILCRRWLLAKTADYRRLSTP
jgi:hypothetical protein